MNTTARPRTLDALLRALAQAGPGSEDAIAAAQEQYDRTREQLEAARDAYQAAKHAHLASREALKAAHRG